jgi:histidyl-tRNA synthetase
MKIQSVKGFHDVLPDESARWAWVEARARAVFAQYNFSEIRLPIVERTELFSRSIGETTDIVEKEMYTFADRDGSSLTLRPEGTASVVRAYVEHALAQQEPVSKLYYFGPMFRRERPQKGRLRQFAQIGCEVIGRDDAAVDAEVLLLLHDLLAAVRVRGARIELNSLGCAECRPAYRAELRAFGEQRRADLCENCARRLERNPLRLLDCKDRACREVTADAPVMLDHLCAACRDHFDTVRGMLAREGVEPDLNPRMVRALGGPDAAGIGFALGMERLVLSMADHAAARRQPPALFLAPLGAAAESEAVQAAHRWRLGGLRIEVGAADKSLKSQMRLANKVGAPFVLIIGEDELAAGAATARDMVAKRDFARAVALGLSAEELRALLGRIGQEPVEQRAS